MGGSGGGGGGGGRAPRYVIPPVEKVTVGELVDQEIATNLAEARRVKELIESIRNAEPGELVVCALNAGQGDCCVMRLPDGRIVVVDCNVRSANVNVVLMSEPKLLLLDEPSMGLAPMMVERIFGIVHDIAARGVTILLVEQNARLALQAASRGYVMESGSIALAGSARELLDDPRVKEAYLGEARSA